MKLKLNKTTSYAKSKLNHPHTHAGLPLYYAPPNTTHTNTPLQGVMLPCIPSSHRAAAAGSALSARSPGLSRTQLVCRGIQSSVWAVGHVHPHQLMYVSPPASGTCELWLFHVTPPPCAPSVCYQGDRTRVRIKCANVEARSLLNQSLTRQVVLNHSCSVFFWGR